MRLVGFVRGIRMLSEASGSQRRMRSTPKPMHHHKYPNMQYKVYSSALMANEVKGLRLTYGSKVNPDQTADERSKAALATTTEDRYEKFPWDRYSRAIGVSFAASAIAVVTTLVSVALWVQRTSLERQIALQTHRVTQLMALTQRLEDQVAVYKNIVAGPGKQPPPESPTVADGNV
ncbi:hypothetical protein DIPPA_26439 [Diplonema papillatum]|nr:hypothetical protein DIPPA_26439 [Diplonema papillatum]